MPGDGGREPLLLRLPLADVETVSHSRALQQIVECLDRGELVAFPTDTIWGVAALAEDPAAVERLYRLKRREPRKPLPVFVSGLGAARELLAGLPPPLERLAGRYWPGPLTVVAEARPGRLGPVLAPDGTVGIRVPAVHMLIALLEALEGRPLACTSANLSGEPPLADAEAVLRQLGGGLGAVADHDEPRGAAASSVVGWRAGRLQVFREGAIGREELLAAAEPAPRS